MKKSKIAIILPAEYPVPTVKGGAIETLIENFIDENENSNELDITLYSYFDKIAFNESKKYKNTKFKFIKINKVSNRINYLCNKVSKKILNKDINNIFIKKVIKDIKNNNIKEIIIEGNKAYVLPIKNKIKDSNIYLHIHHDAFCENNELNQIIGDSCKKIITVSDYITNKTKECVPKSQVITLKNCTNVKTFKHHKEYEDYRKKLRLDYDINDEEIVILFTGRILEIKGIKELILAFKRYCANLNSKLVIVGDAGFGNSIKTSYDEELLEIAKDIENKIIFTGFIHNSELPKIHAMSDIAVVPSIWDEPAGLVVLEAMASGLPLVVTDSGGIPEYTDNNCALIIKRDEDLIKNLGENLLKLINNKDLRNQMSESGIHKSLEFDTSNYYYNFINILKDSENN